MSDTLADGQVKGQRFDLDQNGLFDPMNDLKLKSVILPHQQAETMPDYAVNFPKAHCTNPYPTYLI